MARNPWTLEVADAIADRHPTEMVSFFSGLKVQEAKAKAEV